MASKLMTAPSASVRSVNSVLKTGAWLVLVTVQVKRVGVGERAVADGEVTV